MGARRLRIGASVVSLGFVLALVLGALGVGTATQAYGAGTTLTVLSGEVLVLHAGASDFVPAVDGEVLDQGDVLRTGGDGRAILTYFEGSTVTIEPVTELAIDDASTSPDGGTVVRMTQTVGRSWHVVTKLITGGSKYEVRTPASTASVRGTEFQVDSDDTTTTVSTTEGTVLAQVQDTTGTTVDVPVRAGDQQKQDLNAPPAPAEKAPEPERKVTVTVGSTNTLVVDPLGRANGVTKDGKLVVQTPGAQVKRVGDTVVVTLPNLPDGKVSTQVDGSDHDVAVETKVVDKGGKTVIVDDKAKTDTKKTGVEITTAANGDTQGRALDSNEKKDLPTAKTAEPRPSPRATEHTATSTPEATRRATETARASGEPATATPRVIPTQRFSATPRASGTPRAGTPATETPRPTSTSRATETARATATARASETRAPSAQPSATPGRPQTPPTAPPSRIQEPLTSPLQQAPATRAPTAAPRTPAPTERRSSALPTIALPRLPTAQPPSTRRP